MTNEIIEISPDKIQISRFYNRDKQLENEAIRDHEDESLENLVESIKQHGIIDPIKVLKLDGKYQIDSGERRFKAAMQLGLKKIPVQIVKDLDLPRALNENVFKKPLRDIEKANQILEAYKNEGFKEQQILQGTLWLSKNLSRSKSTSRLLGDTRGGRNKIDVPNEKFREICRKITYAPGTQYNLLLLAVRTEKDVVQRFEELGISQVKKRMLTHSTLRDHPKMQTTLAKQVRNMDDDTAREVVHQTIHDLDTHYIEKTEAGYVQNIGTDRELIKDADKQSAPVQLLELLKYSTDVIYRLTNFALTRGHYEYTEKIIENTKKHRVELIKSIRDERQLEGLHRRMSIIRTLADEMIELVDREFESRKLKQKLSSK